MTESTLDIQELEKLRSPNSNTKTEEKDRASQQKWQMILEPTLVGAMMAINLGQTSLQNFYLRTACTVDLGLPLDVCDRGVGEEFRSAEAASQMVVSSVNVSRSFVGSLLATVVLLFVGPWSDCSGRRKPLLILPLLGMCVMTTGVLLMLTFPGASTVQVLYMVQIPISLGGNFGLLLAAAFSYIGDLCHSTGRDVTRTMGSHRAAIQIAHVVGAVSGPLLYRSLGFYGVFPLVLLLQLLSLVYVVVMVHDVNVNVENKVSVVNWRLPVKAVQCLLRPRDGHKRLIILLMMVVALGDRMLLSAEVLLSYMFFRYKFHFDDVLFGSYLAYKNTISFLGTLLILALLKRRLRLSDETVGVLSCMSYVLATTSLITITNTIVVFVVPILGIISQGSQVVQRPLLNRQILPTEQGKIYSVMGALESATQTLSSPLYSLLYTKTVSVMPDAWLIPGIILAVIQLLAYVVTRRLNTKKRDIPKNIQLPILKTKEGTKDFKTKDESIIDLNTKDESTKDIKTKGEIIKDIKVEDESTKDIKTKGEIIRDIKVEDESIKDIKTKDEIIKYIKVEDESIKDIKSKDESIKDFKTKEGNGNQSQLVNDSK